MEIELGNKVRDKVTGFEGIAIAKIEYINGCIQFCVKPKVKEDGKMPDGEYIDVDDLEIVYKGIIIEVDSTGGPQRDYPRK